MWKQRFGFQAINIRRFRYQLNRSRNGSMYWRCWKKDCRSGLKTNAINLHNPNPIIRVIYDNDVHNHPHEDRAIEEAEYVNTMKEQIIANPTVPVKRVYNDTVARAHQNAGAAGAAPPEIPDFTQVRSSLGRTKALQCPQIPQDINQVQTVGAFSKTFLGERYLLHQDNGIGIVIFATDNELQVMANCQTLYVDGTFRTAPAPYAQVFTIHGEYMGRVILLAVALLTGKTQQHYDAVFNVIMAEIRRVTGNNAVNVQTVVSDFELAVFNSVRASFPIAQIGGCYFHFLQNLWKYVQEVGLAVGYRNDGNLKRCLRLCFSLGFLPLENIANLFNALMVLPETIALVAQYPNLQLFFDYIRNTYIIGNNYPPDTWNVFNRGMCVRTNNYVESYFGRWNKSVGVAHPSLWTVIRKLKDEQAVARNSLIRAHQGYAPIPRKRKWRRMETRINNLKTSLLNGERNMFDYWNAISHTIQEF